MSIDNKKINSKGRVDQFLVFPFKKHSCPLSRIGRIFSGEKRLFRAGWDGKPIPNDLHQNWHLGNWNQLAVRAALDGPTTMSSANE